jgi:hypothetical protein
MRLLHLLIELVCAPPIELLLSAAALQVTLAALS